MGVTMSSSMVAGGGDEEMDGFVAGLRPAGHLHTSTAGIGGSLLLCRRCGGGRIGDDDRANKGRDGVGGYSGGGGGVGQGLNNSGAVQSRRYSFLTSVATIDNQ
ncbi:unnamed protein product [Triticum turgidum subsp. durum]|uniref:Uncharacterized protein n=1 Tax=Triticum turgidum subsp. durum TaxID=4567 RepID=A0A9R0VPG4_TRITD|nr:unnamed protein product [Triticum turgidum subsp. durum]